MAELDLDAVKARVDKAHAHIGDLCTGRSHWKMTIPVNTERDSDIILTRALADADWLMDEVKRLRAQRDKALDVCDVTEDHGWHADAYAIASTIRAIYAEPTPEATP